MRDKIIRHEGVVQQIADGRVMVIITQMPACAACKAARQCHAAESNEKTITVYGTYPQVKVGDRVVVAASASQGMQAVMWAFTLPFIILVAVLVAVIAAGGTELLAATLAIAATAVYYLALFLLRSRFTSHFSFRIL